MIPSRVSLAIITRWIMYVNMWQVRSFRQDTLCNSIITTLYAVCVCVCVCRTCMSNSHRIIALDDGFISIDPFGL